MKVAMKYHSEHCIYLLVVLASVVMCGWGVRFRLHSSVGQEGNIAQALQLVSCVASRGGGNATQLRDMSNLGYKLYPI